jgi:protein MpaA
MRSCYTNKLKYFSFLAIFFSVFSWGSTGVVPQKGHSISGSKVRDVTNFESHLGPLSLESFPKIHKYLDFVLDLEKIVEFPPKKLSPKKIVHSPRVGRFCKKVSKKFLKFGWGKSRCHRFPWNHVRNSVNGDPLIWMTYGDELEHKKVPKNTTLILCGVHGDEITPIKFCYDILNHLEKNKQIFKERLIVVAPIVNPDSFFKRRPTRTNWRGIDINRNFPTKDWNKSALKLWKRRYRRDKRRYPGKKAFSEPEVIFQVNLIKRYQPNKIISVHAPLTIIDYDGPTQKGFRKASQLLIHMSKKASGYRIKNYPFFPGSLGNWAGNERGIPTYTLELPSTDNRKHKVYWKLFKTAIHAALLQDFRIDDGRFSK